MPTRLALCLLLLSSVAFAAKPDAAEDAYQEARKAYYELKGDAARRKMRHHWLKVVSRFESVATDFPKSERAPDALFTAGELMSELSRISFLPEDLQAAVSDYSKLVEAHPKHRLADDAALSLARIQFERLEQPEAAHRVITDMLAINGKGDRARDLKDLLAQLPASKAAPAPALARKASTPAVAEVAPAQPEPEKAGASLVDAISKLARDAAPAPNASPVKEPEAPRVVVITPLKSETTPATTVPVKSSTEVAAAPAKASETRPAPAQAVASASSKFETPVAAPVAPKAAPVKEAPASIASAPSKSSAAPQPLPSLPALDQHVAEARLKAAANIPAGRS